MKIGLDVTPLQNGHRFRGVGSYTRGLLYGLSVLDTDDSYALYYWKGLPLQLDQMVFPRNSTWIGIPYPKAGRFSALISQQLLMLPSLFTQRLDVYHQLGIVADPSAGGVPWAFANRSIVTVHDLTPLVYSDRFLNGKRVRQLIYRLMLTAVRHAKHMIADSEATRGDLERLLGIRGQAITVTPLAVSPALAEALESSQPDGDLGLPEDYILTVAGDYPNKGLDTLLDAYKELAFSTRVPDLMIVGPKGNTVDRFNQLNPDIAQRLHLREGISDRVLAAAYKGAMMVVVPSEYEGFGLPVLEAMAAGVPVIASNATSLPEVAGDAAISVSSLVTPPPWLKQFRY